jgi:general secretion pathway protein D
MVAIKPSSTTIPNPDDLLPPGMIDFRQLGLDEVLRVYAELVNRTVLRPSNLASQPIVLKTQNDLTRREAVEALDAVLGMNGIVMVNIGEKFVKAVPTTGANTVGAPFSKLDAGQLPEFGPYVTHVVQLKYAKPSEMLQILQPFASTIPNPILPIDSSQILVLRDFTENIKRMLEMIKEVDVSVPSEFISEVIPIKYALASDISSALTSLSGSGSGGTTVGQNPGGSRSTSGSSRSTTGMNRNSYNQMTPGGVTQPGQPTTPGTVPGSTPGSSFSDRLQRIIQRASVSGEVQVLSQNKIIADERTNSLLIFASREDMKVIKDIVSKLDVVLAQVLIEAVIIEVTLNDQRDIGVSYAEKGTAPNGSPGHGFGTFSGIGSIQNGLLATVSSNSTPSAPGGLSYLGSFGGDLDVTLTAVANDSRAKILQRPRIQTSHAVPATLFVGESRPYPTASYYGGAYGGSSSIQQVQIGVTLDVTPLINPDGLVVMDIHQTIESANGEVQIANIGAVPITSRKEAQAKVAVRDHDTIILGGLIETSKSRSASGVPFLKDLPLLGVLFRQSTDKEVRNELIVLIRPTVLPTPEVAALTARAEKEKMPGIRKAESEIQAEENRRIKQTERDLRETKHFE